MRRAEAEGPYLIFILALSLFALGALAVQTLVRLDPSTVGILAYADNGVCALFFLDFIISLVRAEKRARYFVRWGWLDLLSSIPMVDALRWGRAARVMRILRVLRGVRSAKILSEFILHRRAQSAFLAATLVSVLLVVMASIAILQFETSPDANIKTPEDALWWAIVTITTVGYGDKYPVSSEGRLMAGFLMVVGVGFFGVLSGFVAAWFLKPQTQKKDNDIEALADEIRQLRELLESKIMKK